MKEFNLTEEEVATINSFRDDISKIPFAECIYLLPGYSFLKRKAVMRVFTIYDELLTDDDSKIQELKALVDKYNTINDRLVFIADESKYYSLAIRFYGQWESERALANGIIIFDRWGNKINNQHHAQLFFKEENTIKIDHVDELTLKLYRKDQSID